MTRIGTIDSYDSETGSGTIQPEQGGAALRFLKTDLKHQQQAAEPQQGQRFSYDTRPSEGGGPCATNLCQHEQHQSELQENEKRNQARQQPG